MKKMAKRVSFAAILMLAALGIFSCKGVWGDFDNPADPDSDSYQGYLTVADVDDVEVVSPKAGGSLSGAEVKVTAVLGATAYQIRLAENAADLESSALYTKTYTANVMDISEAAMEDDTTYWWQARVRGSDGTWGEWTAAASFATDWSVPAAKPAFSPAGGTYTSGQNVTITCATAGATIYYTADGNEPTTASTEYTGAISVSGPGTSTTIRAIAKARWYAVSEEGSATYAIPYVIGDTGPAGGKIFYDKGAYSDGWRYLEAAPSDQSSGIQWYSQTSFDQIVTGTAIGTGAANTSAFVGALFMDPNAYAATICDALSLGGYDDWFLPAKDELNQMYAQKDDIGIASGSYWSSSKAEGGGAAYLQNFENGSQSMAMMTSTTNRVRAVRAF